MADWVKNSETFTLEDAEVLAESRNGKNLLVSAPILDDPIWVPKKVIHDDSEVYGPHEDESGPGDMILQQWWVYKQDWV
jgi:hypothetical protein